MSVHHKEAEDTAEGEAENRRLITAWIEKNVGGKVTKVDRLRRWRRVWRADYELNGEARALLVKGNRPWESIPYSLEHEMIVNQVLEANGVGVPHVYGMIPSPNAFVMDWSAGGRDPGLVQQAIENTSGLSPERWQATLKYMDVLAKIHSIPVTRFDPESGNPTTPHEIAMDHYERNLQLLERRGEVDALMEFFSIWLRRNAPEHRTKTCFVTGDCGQFLSDGENITAILDMEIGHIGDPLLDLACFRGRHPVENMGNVPALYQRYADATGEPVDLNVVAYYTVSFLAFAVVGPMMALADKHRGGDWVEAVMQIGFIARRALDAMAEIIGVSLDDIQLPEPHVTPWEDLALEKLESEISNLPLSPTFQDWQRNVLVSLPQYLRNQVHYGRWLENENMQDVETLLGYRPKDVVSAEEALKVYVQKASPAEDATLVRLFHRRILRLCRLLAGPGAPEDHLLFIKVEPILHLGPMIQPSSGSTLRNPA